MKLAQDWLKAGSERILIAGPCSAESPEQLMETARQIALLYPSNIYRAGVWKPRTHPNHFEGVGEAALEWLSDVKKETGMRTATEVAMPAHIELALKHKVDILWIGTRTTVNPFLIQELADALKGVDIPILVKNPIHPDIQLWIGALQRFSKAGITRLGAIHRGFYTSGISQYRNLPKWEIALELRTLFPELPIICDISHISGNRTLLPSLAQHATDVSMDGLMIETHIDPANAKSDAGQQVTPAQLNDILNGIHFKNPYFTDPVAKVKLQTLRKQINELDVAILEKIAERMNKSFQIGKLKKEQDVTILQMERWKEIMDNCMQFADENEMNVEFIRSIYLLIHDESIRLQSEFAASSLSPVHPKLPSGQLDK